MPEIHAGESFREKLYLLILDKLALGLIIALASGAFSWQLQRQDRAMDYQEALFTKRQEAYQALLVAARDARDEVSVLYTAGQTDRAMGSFAWNLRLDKLQQKAGQLVGRGVGHSSYTFHSDAIAKLQTLDQVRRDNELYISRGVESAVNEFLATAADDMEHDLDIKLKRLDSQPPDQPTQRIIAAYDRLVSVIRKSLRVDELILG